MAHTPGCRSDIALTCNYKNARIANLKSSVALIGPIQTLSRIEHFREEAKTRKPIMQRRLRTCPEVSNWLIIQSLRTN